MKSELSVPESDINIPRLGSVRIREVEVIDEAEPDIRVRLKVKTGEIVVTGGPPGEAVLDIITYKRI